MYTLIETSSGVFSIKGENGKSEAYNLQTIIQALGKNTVEKLLKDYHGKNPTAFLEIEMERRTGLIEFPESQEEKSNFVSKEIVGDSVIKIFYDESVISPREDFSNTGKMSFFGIRRGLLLPDELDIASFENEYGEATPEGIETYLREEAFANSPIEILWLNFSEHGGAQSLSESSISRANGLIVVELSEVEQNMKGCSNEQIKTIAKDILKGELQVMKQYVEGEVYKYEVWKDGEIIDSLSSIYGKDEAIKAAKEENGLIENTADNIIEFTECFVGNVGFIIKEKNTGELIRVPDKIISELKFEKVEVTEQESNNSLRDTLKISHKGKKLAKIWGEIYRAGRGSQLRYSNLDDMAPICSEPIYRRGNIEQAGTIEGKIVEKAGNKMKFVEL